jgi:hypothetical protein
MKVSVASVIIVTSLATCLSTSSDATHPVIGMPGKKGYEDAQSALPAGHLRSHRLSTLDSQPRQVVRLTIAVKSISESCSRIYTALHSKHQNEIAVDGLTARPIPPDIASNAGALKEYERGWVAGCGERIGNR